MVDSVLNTQCAIEVGLHEILAAIRQLAAPPEPPPQRRIGFVQG